MSLPGGRAVWHECVYTALPYCPPTSVMIEQHNGLHSKAQEAKHVYRQEGLVTEVSST